MRLYFFLLLAIVGTLFSCNEEITIGSTILEDTTIDVSFTDTFDVEVKTVLDDTVVTYRTNVDSRTFLLGELNDPSFGFSKSDIYISTQLNGTIPSFDTLNIDSVIMIFPLDTFGQLGNEAAIHNIEVFQLQEELKVDDDTNQILSSDSFEYGTTRVGQYNNVINHRDSIDLALGSDRDSFVRSFAQLRIPMDIGFWFPIVRDTSVFNTDNFKESVKGFVLRSSPDDSSIAGLNLSNNSPLSITVYYTNLSGNVQNSYRIDIGAIRSSEFMHDYSNTPVGDAIDQVNTDFAYLQSMQGVNLNVDLSSVKTLENTIINKAQLEFFLLEETDPFVGPIQSLDVIFVTEEGITTQILDSGLSNTSADYLGGELESTVIGGQTLRKYELDITNHVVLIARGEIENPIISIEARNKPQRATRSILLGQSHPDFPMRLKLVTSKP